MRLLILNGPRDPYIDASTTYRGTYRAHPTFTDAYPDHHPVNLLFAWFIDEGGENGVVRNLERALEYSRVLNACSCSQSHYEVVEVVSRDEEPESCGTLLGYDLSSGCSNSLLYYGLNYDTNSPGLSLDTRDLLENIQHRFSPLLN